MMSSALGVIQTCDSEDVTSAFDPERTSDLNDAQWSVPATRRYRLVFQSPRYPPPPAEVIRSLPLRSIMYPSQIRWSLCSAGMIAGGSSIAHVLPTLSRDANSSVPSRFLRIGFIAAVWHSLQLQSVRSCSHRVLTVLDRWLPHRAGNVDSRAARRHGVALSFQLERY